MSGDDDRFHERLMGFESSQGPPVLPEPDDEEWVKRYRRWKREREQQDAQSEVNSAAAVPEVSIAGPSAIDPAPHRRLPMQDSSTGRVESPRRLRYALVAAAVLFATFIGFQLLETRASETQNVEVLAQPTARPPGPTSDPTAEPTPTSAVPTLAFAALVDPFECNGLHETARVIGQVSGFGEDEPVYFEWVSANGDLIASSPKPAVKGARELRWDCNPSEARVVEMRAIGESPDRAISFSFTTVAAVPMVADLADPLVCTSEASSPVVATVSGFDSEADGGSAENVEIRWTDGAGNARATTLRSDTEGRIEVRWDCSDNQARAIELTTTGVASDVTTSFFFNLEAP